MTNSAPSGREAAVLDRITEQAWLELAAALIPAGQPEAENPLDPDEPPAREEAAALYVAALLKSYGFEVDLVARREGRPNVIGVLPGAAASGPSLILNDHLDTYPAGDWGAWTETGGHPFRPTRRGDRLYARGTSDTRGNLAAILLAVRAIREAGVTLKGELKLVFTVDEERNGPDGSIFLLDETGLAADHVIVCEPTGWTEPEGRWGMGVAVANGGHALVEVAVHGVKTHLWRPDTGVNAGSKLAKLIPRVEATAFAHEPAKRAGGTPPLASVLRVAAGEPRELQFTPDRARAIFGVVGLVPGQTAEGVLADIERTLDAARSEDPDLIVEARLAPGSLFVSATIEQDETAEPVAALSRAYERVLSERPRLYRKNAFNDTIRFSERGFPAVTFGPGEDGWPPVNEYIHIDKAVAATRILALTVLDLLGHEAEA